MSNDHSQHPRDQLRSQVAQASPEQVDGSERKTGIIGTQDQQPISAFGPNAGSPNEALDDSNAPTRMTPLDEVNAEVVIASSRIQSLEHHEPVVPDDERQALPHRPSQMTVREQERHRGRLIITYESTRTIKYIEREPISLGRDHENEVELIDPKVSRKHLRIEQTLESFRLIDISASNGVRVNGQKVRTRELFHGALIQLGDTTIRFENLGWLKKPSQGSLDSSILGWAKLLTQLSRQDQSRLAIYSVSLSFLTGGLIFLLMSFLAYPRQPTPENQSLSYRRQAEKRALAGDLVGALDSLDKVTFIAGSLSNTDLRRRAQWMKRRKELEISRTIQVQALADPLPVELDELFSQLVVDQSIQADAAAHVSQSKLAHLSRALEVEQLMPKDRTRLENVYNEIDAKLVDRKQYEAVSRALFRRSATDASP
jgi:pSer/pThr/pTyr-binding forkhead associated (FHA) protein